MDNILIGITSGHGKNEYGANTCQTPATYIASIRQAGGIPVLLPATLTADELPHVLNRLDGVLLIGGSDIDPALFDGDLHPRVYGIDPARDQMEIALIHQLSATKKPFLAICRGIQAFNVALGGSLYTDIADQFSAEIRHDCFPDMPPDHIAHTVQIEQDSLLAQIIGESQIPVNSLHHQGIKKHSAAVRVVAHAPDGMIEAIELTDHPFALGVQWHPERLPEDAHQCSLFKALINACSK